MHMAWLDSATGLSVSVPFPRSGMMASRERTCLSKRHDRRSRQPPNPPFSLIFFVSLPSFLGARAYVPWWRVACSPRHFTREISGAGQQIPTRGTMTHRPVRSRVHLLVAIALVLGVATPPTVAEARRRRAVAQHRE